MPVSRDRLQRHAVAYRPYSLDPCEAERSRQLWVWVIIQAMCDATALDGDTNGEASDPQSCWRRRDVRTRKRQTIAWLTRPNPDFAFVCEMAGFDPGFVRVRAVIFIKNHERLRRIMRAFGASTGNIARWHRGYPTTFADATGTGGGSRAHDFQNFDRLQSLQISEAPDACDP